MAKVEVNFQLRVLTDIVALLRPVRDVVGSLNGPRQLLGSLGWDLDAIPGFPFGPLDTQLQKFASNYDQLQAKLDPPPATLEDWGIVLEASSGAVAAVVEIGTIVGGLSVPGLANVGAEIVNLLAVRFLSRLHPTLYQLLILLTIVQEKQIDAVVDQDRGEYLRFPVSIPEVKLGHLADLIRQPEATLKAEYGLANGLTDAVGTADKLFPRIAAILQTLNLNAVYGVPASVGATFGTHGHELANHMLTVIQPVASSPSVDLGFGATVALDNDLGVVVRPFGALSFHNTLANWAIAVDASIGVEGFAVSSTDLVFPQGSPIQSADIQLAAAKLPAPDQISDDGSGPAFLVGSTDGTRLEVGQFQVNAHTALHPGAIDYGLGVDIKSGALVISSGDGDGFLSQVLPSNTRIDFDFGVAWSKLKGLTFRGAAGLELSLPVNVSIGGVVDVSAIQLGIRTQGQDLKLVTSADATAHIGPVEATAEKVGLAATLTFPDGGGNLGPLNVALGFKLPDGIGIEIDAGPVVGGGFLFIDTDAGRYSGAVELSVYGIAVKAFGIIDTKFPDGHSGFSFIIVISAEFTPIQLGFGFTLLGVGGIVGINRTLDVDGLRAVVRSHGLDNVLFPTDPVGDAPAIIADLGAIFPPAEGHYAFGPMAKLGWGTPTLIDAEIGIVLVLPGPLLAILGEVHSVLPTQSFPLVELNFAVVGVLDFPQKTFALDASLHDSHVGDFPVSGDMAMRVSWGANPNFALSVGGFHPAFKPPSGFPSLARVSVDLGSNGNPSLTLSGYLAITSNTAQIGARAELNAHGGGLKLHGYVGFDALFVFSPFSFTVDFSAGIDVTFHGHGIGLHAHGQISGPTPWHISGSVCVSILFWDACLDFSKTFGGSARVELPALDPFLGSPSGVSLESQEVVGLQNALQDPRNWSSVAPPGAFAAVALAESPPDAPPPIDPVGAAELHQRVLPLNRPITLFAGAKPLGPGSYTVQAVTLSGSITANTSAVQDNFAPAAFKKMSDAEKLSTPSFEKMDSGIQVSSDKVTVGTVVPRNIVYNTIVIDPRVSTPPAAPDFTLTQRHLDGMTARSAAALAGLRVTGTQRFIDPTAKIKVLLADVNYTIAALSTLAAATGFTTAPSKSLLTLALSSAVAANPILASQLQVVPVHEIQ